MAELRFDQAKLLRQDGGTWLCIRVMDTAPAKAFLAAMKPGVYLAALKREGKRRSLDANAYAWLLLGKLAAKTEVPREEIYRSLIRDVGDNYEILPIRDKAVDAFIERWGFGRLGWVVDNLGASKLAGYTNLCAYYGSSTYDTQQMARLIDLIVQECRQQDIETMGERELSLLKEEWRR